MKAWPNSPTTASRLAAAWEILPRGVLELACHAAVPVALDTGFLHLLRVNFFLDPPMVLEYGAEAELLLSPLVRELGDGLYEIDPPVRRLLLYGLTARFGPARPRRVATLLEQYTAGTSAWQAQPELVYAQRLTALNLIDERLAADWLARAEEAASGRDDLLGKEWFVAMHRSISEHVAPDTPPGHELDDALTTLRTGTPDDRTAAAHRIGELALVPGCDIAKVLSTLDALSQEESAAGRIGQDVYAAIMRLIPPPVETAALDEEVDPWPRRQILDIWRAAVRRSFRDGRSWVWGGAVPRNAVSDAEQLLCLLQPATAVASLQLAKPDKGVLDALRILGTAEDIIRTLTGALVDYFQYYSGADGAPVFSGHPTAESGDDEPTPEQLSADMVDSFAISISLCLAAKRFTRGARAVLTRMDLLSENRRVDELASRRLSAAMVGLLRSFTISAFDHRSARAESLLHMLNQGRFPRRYIIDEIQYALRPTTAGLAQLTPSNYWLDPLDGGMYECGWSWGLVKHTPIVDYMTGIVHQPDGHALEAPDLYFTVAALDSIAELLSARPSERLLDGDQHRLVTALQSRYELTVSYWSTIATLGTRRWPLADLPWRTTDGSESDYSSLMVAAVTAHGLAAQRDSTPDLSRLGLVLEELGQRARITRRPIRDDPAIKLHYPGVSTPLDGAEELGPRLCHTATDFAHRLLKQAIQLAALSVEPTQRRWLLAQADQVWAHVLGRRHDDRGENDLWHGLWDDPANVFLTIDQRYTQPNWHDTLLVVRHLSARLT